MTRRRFWLFALLLVFCLTPAGVLAAAGNSVPARQQAVSAAVKWFHGQQKADGHIGALGDSCDAVRAIASAGENPASPAWSRGNTSLLAACEADVATYLARRDTGRMAKVLRAVIAAGANPRQFGGLDLIAELEAKYNPATGLYDPNFFFRHDLAVLALHEAGRPLPAGVLAGVLAQQRPNGSWGWAVEPTPEDGFSTPGDLDATARTLQVLHALGLPLGHPAYNRAVSYTRAQQRSDGGWGLLDGPTNANSTALAIDGLLAAGWDPESTRFQRGGKSPVQVLLGLQAADGGFNYRPGAVESRLMATLDAVPTLLQHFPSDTPTSPVIYLPYEMSR